MICKKCKTVNEETYNFCNQCGTRLEAPKSEPVKQESFAEEKPTSKLDLGNVQYGKVYIAFGLVFLVILGTAFSSMSSTSGTKVSESSFAESKEEVHPNKALTLEEINSIASPFCSEIDKALESEVSISGFLKNVSAKKNALDAAGADAFAAAAFVKKNPDLANETPYYLRVSDVVQPIMQSKIGPLLKPKLSDSEYESFESNQGFWIETLYSFVMLECDYSDSLSKLTAFNSALTYVSDLSLKLPWYPKGFVEIPSHPGFAFKASNRSCSYSFGACANLLMVSKTDCPTNLYVEMNLLKNDVVVDWGNDTARVRANQIAELEISFSGNGDSTEFTDINCY